MAHTEIEYRVPCGLLQTILKIEESPLNELGQDTDEVPVTTGSGGILSVRMIDDDTLYNNQQYNPEINLVQLKEIVGGRLTNAK